MQEMNWPGIVLGAVASLASPAISVATEAISRDPTAVPSLVPAISDAYGQANGARLPVGLRGFGPTKICRIAKRFPQKQQKVKRASRFIGTPLGSRFGVDRFQAALFTDEGVAEDTYGQCGGSQTDSGVGVFVVIGCVDGQDDAHGRDDRRAPERQPPCRFSHESAVFHRIQAYLREGCLQRFIPRVVPLPLRGAHCPLLGSCGLSLSGLRLGLRRRRPGGGWCRL